AARHDSRGSLVVGNRPTPFRNVWHDRARGLGAAGPAIRHRPGNLVARMSHRRPWFSARRQGRCTRPSRSGGRLPLCFLALLLLAATFARSQDTQFQFDASGNLLRQAAVVPSVPVILGQPQLQVVMPGALASFIVVAADTRGLSYQWRFNGSNI